MEYYRASGSGEFRLSTAKERYNDALEHISEMLSSRVSILSGFRGPMISKSELSPTEQAALEFLRINRPQWMCKFLCDWMKVKE